MLLIFSNVSEAQAAGRFGVPAPAVAAHSAATTYLPDSTQARPTETFLGYDKVKHFMMSGFIEAIGFNALQAANVDRSASLGAATAVTLGIGVARELHDRKTNGLFSLGDLAWDALGIGSALLLISHTQR